MTVEMPRLLARFQKRLTTALNERKARRITAEQYGKAKSRILKSQAKHDAKVQAKAQEREADRQATALARKFAKEAERAASRVKLVSYRITRHVKVYNKVKKGKKKITYDYNREFDSAPYEASFQITQMPRESNAHFQGRIQEKINEHLNQLDSDIHHGGAEGEGETWTTHSAGSVSVSSGGSAGSAMTRKDPYNYEFKEYASITMDGNCVPESLAKLYPKYSLDRIQREMGGAGAKTPEEVLEWCERHDISCLGCDEDFNVLVQYTSRNRNHAPCYFVSKDNHFYVMDKSKGLSIANSRSNSVKKEAVKKVIERSVVVSNTVDFEASNTHFITSKTNLMRPLVEKYIDEKHSVPAIEFGALDEKTLYVKSFQFGNNNKVSVNNHYELIQHTLKAIENDSDFKEPIKANTIRELASNLFANTVPNFPKSRLNNVVMKIMTEWKQRQHYAHLSDPVEWENVGGIEQTWDANKQYSSALHNMPVNWVFFNMFALPKPYSGGVKDAYYYIETENTMPCKGNGWYSRIIVEWLRSHNAPHTILFEIEASRTLPPTTFQPFVQKAMELVPVALKTKETPHLDFKFITNTLCGSLNTHTVQRVKGKVGANIKDTVQRCMTTQGHFYQVSNDITACANISIEECNENNMPLYAQVLDWASIQLANAIEHLKSRGCVIRGYNTDSITFKHDEELAIDLPTCVLGGWKKETPKPFDRQLDPQQRCDQYCYSEPDWITDKLETDFKDSNELIQHLAEHGGVLQGQAGFGKSWVLKGVIDKVSVENCLVLGYTNISAHNVGGKTFHSTFKINIDTTMRYDPNAVLNGKTHLIIDEISQVPSELYGLIELAVKRKMTIILAGDFAQILPIGETNVQGLDALTKIIAKHRITMTVYKRGDAELLNRLINVRNRVSVAFENTEKGNLHFCFTKKKRDFINEREMAKVKKGYLTLPKNDLLPKVYRDMPLRSCKTKENGDWLNNQRWKVVRVGMSDVVVQSADKTITVSIDDLIENFVPGYAMTIHSSQGLTITEPYTVWWEKYTAFSEEEIWRLLYTATSRATTKDQIGVIQC